MENISKDSKYMKIIKNLIRLGLFNPNNFKESVCKQSSIPLYDQPCKVLKDIKKFFEQKFFDNPDLNKKI